MTQPPNGGQTDPPGGRPPDADPAHPEASAVPAQPSAGSTAPTGSAQPSAGSTAPTGSAQPSAGSEPSAAEALPPGPQTVQLGQPGLETVQFTQPGADRSGPEWPDPTAPPPGYPTAAYPPPEESPRRRGGLIVSLVLAAAILLCAAGGTTAFLLLRNSESGEGAPEPVAAVDAFMTAVYTDKDATKAAEVVCAEARDKDQIAKKVREVKGYATKYDKPRFNWTTPKVEDQNADRAIVSTKLTMITADEKTADEQLKFTVVQKTGWWVCEVS